MPAGTLIVFACCTTAGKNLVGYWYKPRTRSNVRFYQNKIFAYSHYDPAANKAQTLTGKYRLEGTPVTPGFAGRATETLTLQ